MGMFDYIKIEDQIEIEAPVELGDYDFQTKSLDCSLSIYIIANDKHLYLQNDEKRELINFHGIIDFGSYIQNDLIDYSLDYKAKFTDGILQEINLVDFKSYEHESLKEKMADLKAKQKSSIPRAFRFGDYMLCFYHPRVIFGYRNQFKNITYGFSMDDITTEMCFTKSPYKKQFSFKILGLGFTLTKVEKIKWN